MEIPKKIKEEIWDYCRINDIPNIDEFILKMVSQGFTVEKYGAAPTPREKIIEKVVEKIVEVPVEKIVEVIKEVKVEVIKEVFVEGDTKEVVKIVRDNAKENELVKENETLKKENEKLTNELKNITDTLENVNKAKYLKSSNLNNLYDE